MHSCCPCQRADESVRIDGVRIRSFRIPENTARAPLMGERHHRGGATQHWRNTANGNRRGEALAIWVRESTVAAEAMS
jgi:hypothetical protein